MAYIRLEPKSS